MNYKLVMFLNGEKEVESKQEALKIARKELKLGEEFKLFKICNADHRSNPNQTILTTYNKVRVIHLCDKCGCVISSKSRLIKDSGFVSTNVCKFRNDVECINPYCNKYYDGVDRSMDDDEHFHVYNWSLTNPLRASEFPILNRLRFFDHLSDGCNYEWNEEIHPSFIKDDLPFEEYMEEWYSDYISGRLPHPGLSGIATEEETKWFNQKMIDFGSVEDEADSIIEEWEEDEILFADEPTDIDGILAEIDEMNG